MDVKVTNMVKFYTLMLLHSGPVHGYDVIKKTGEKIGKKVSPGQIYPFLQKLVKGGYVKARKTGGREKKVYVLTPKGREFVRNTLTRFSDMIDMAVSSKLKTCAHCGCEVYRGGVNSGGKAFCCSSCAHAYR